MAIFPKLDVYINQNVVVLIVALLGLGFSEFYNLKTLYMLSLIMSIWMGISVCASMSWYTIRYINKRKGY